MKEQISTMGLIGGPVLFLLFISFPTDGLTFQARVVFATALWMAAWWVTEAIPIYATALLPLVIFSGFNVATLPELSKSYADRVVFLLFGGFIVATAIERSGLHERFALNVIRIFGSKPRSIIGGFMMATGVLSAWTSNTATTILMLPIATSIIGHVKNEVERARFGTCLMLSLAYSASLGGMATLVGTPPNAIFVSLTKSILGTEVSFGQWMLIGVPISVISLVVVWWYMVRFGARISKEPIAEEKGIILARIRQLGSITKQEKIVAVVFGSTAIAWVSRGLVWGKFVPMVDDSTIAVVAALVLFAIPKDRHRILDWESAAKIPWGVLILIGGGLALASGFTVTGLDKWIAEKLMIIQTTNLLLVLAFLVAFTIFSGEIMSNTAGAALIIPISASIASSLGINPIFLMLAVTLATSHGFLLPVGTPPNAIVFGSGYVTARQMAKAGFVLDMLAIGIVTLVTFLLVPIVLG